MRIEKLDRRNSATVEATARLYCWVFAEYPWCETWTFEDALQNILDPLLEWWIVRDEKQKVVGFVSGTVSTTKTLAQHFSLPEEILSGQRVGYKAELGVIYRLRRTGLARRLSNVLLDHFREENIDQFIVRTRPGTGNHPWYDSRLTRLHTYADGRVVFGAPGIPEL